MGGPFVPGEGTTRDKMPFCPGWWLHRGQKAPLLSRVHPPPGTKGPFVSGRGSTRDKRAFCPGSWLHPGQKVFSGGPGKFPARGQPLVYHPGQKGPVFPHFSQILCLFLFLFTSLLKLAFIC